MSQSGLRLVSGTEVQSRVNQRLGFVLLVSLSVLWGLAFVAIRRAVVELSPVNLTLMRWLIASGSFLLLSPIIGRSKTRIKKEHVPRLLVVSFASVAGYHLSLNYAETIVLAGLSGLLISFGPIFIVLLSVLLLKEKLSRRLVVALALAVTGAFALSLGADLSFSQITGPLAVVLAAFSYAVFSVGSKPLVKEYGALPMAVWFAVIGTVFLFPLLSWNFVVQVHQLSLAGWFSVLYLAILSTVVANFILYTLISSRAVSKLGIQLYLVPIVSLVGGVLILGEAVTSLTIVGAALLLSATGLATSRK